MCPYYDFDTFTNMYMNRLEYIELEILQGKQTCGRKTLVKLNVTRL